MRKVVIYDLESGEISCCTDVMLQLGVEEDKATESDWRLAIAAAAEAAGAMGLGCIEGQSHPGQMVVDGALVDRPLSLAEIKAARWSEVKRQRDLLEASGFPYLGKRLDSDARSVQRINTAVQAAQAALAAGAAFPIVWTCADNSLLVLNAEGVVGMPVALALYADQLHQVAKGLRMQIDAATTPAEVQAVAWPVKNSQE